MEELKGLVDLVSKNKLKQLDLPNTNGKSHRPSQIWELYEGLASGRFQEEEETAQYFFGDTKHQKAYFGRLKRKLQNRLTDLLFLIDINEPQYTDTQRAAYACYKDLTAAKILIGRGQRRLAVPIMEKVFKKARAFELTEISLEATRFLRTHYGTIDGKPRKFEIYNKYVHKYEKLLHAEMLAEEYYTRIAANFTQSRSTKTNILEEAARYAEELQELIQTRKSYRLYLFSYMVFVLRHEIANDYSMTLIACKEALNLMEKQNPQTSTSGGKSAFLYKMLASHIQLQNFDDGEKTANKILEITPQGSTNWYITLQYYLILAFHSGQFQKAYHIYHQAAEHPNFDLQYESHYETWRIYEAFLYYLISIGKVKPSSYKPYRKFRTSKFLNEVPIYTKDKRGHNISILILQVLLLLQEGRHPEIVDRIEPLKTYNERYLRKDDSTFRSNCFIKMLLELPKNAFHKAAVVRKAQRYRKRLREVPLNVANQSSEVEIIPYEMLWDMILESLDHQFH